MSTESVRRRRVDKDVSISEMLRLRDGGMSNADIAKSLEISYPTVLKYIGKQGGHMSHIKAFSEHRYPDKQPLRVESSRVEPKLSGELFSYGQFLATVDYAEGSTFFCVRGGSGITIPIQDMASFAQFAVSIAYKGGVKNA